MPHGHDTLTEKEKETLRLLVRGYDAKTIARHLELSVHTVNERLRNARRKMSASSSREAARALLDNETGSPNFIGDKPLGEAIAGPNTIWLAAPKNGHGIRIVPAMVIGGIFIMSLIIAMLAFTPLVQTGVQAINEPPIAAKDPAASAAIAESDVALSARQWLALVDERKWNDSWKATGKAFQQLNTNEKWASVAGDVQPKFGAVRARNFKSQEFVPAPPYGYELIKFQTNFENRPNATEVVTLEKEDSVWKVVGYWIE